MTEQQTESAELTEKHEKKRILPFLKTAGSVLLLLFSVILVGYYVLFPSRGYFHSDTTDTIMWAQASYDSGSLFNPDFSYACLLPFGTSLIMTALIPLTGVTMTTHVLGMLCFALLYAGTMILMLRRMGWHWGWISLTVFCELMICSSSTKLREIFWGHTIYYSLGVLFIFVGLAMIFRQIDFYDRSAAVTDEAQLRKNTLHMMAGMLLTGIWFLLTGSDQITSITIFALPVIGAVFCERWFDRETKILSMRNFYTSVLLLVMIIGVVAGFVLTKLAAGNISALYEEAYSQYSDMGLWPENFSKFPMAWLSLLGVEIKANEPLMSLKSVGALLRVIIGILLLLLPAVALLCWNQIQDRKLKILILTYWFMTLLIMMGYVMGKLSAANWRLSPIAAMSAIVSMAFLHWASSQANWQRMAVLLVIPVLIVNVLQAGTILAMPPDNTARNSLYALAEKLEENHLTYGYASFWQANALTIISDSQVKCRSIAIEEGSAVLRYYQCNQNWYKDQPDQENYFLLLTLSEAQELKNANCILLTHPHETFDFMQYEVWIFEKNIF